MIEWAYLDLVLLIRSFYVVPTIIHRTEPPSAAEASLGFARRLQIIFWLLTAGAGLFFGKMARNPLSINPRAGRFLDNLRACHPD